MPGHARKDIVREGEIGTYHTWSRCVQRACLYGQDPHSGKDFSHRRPIIQALLEYQASVFAVEVGNFSILSNHQHLIARTRPDIAATWNDEEVAWRWKLAWPTWRDDRWIREPTDEEIEELLADPERIPQLRAHLASLSWFMARWKEPISKLCNAEMETKGHFYEQRFGSRELVDDAANLCCNVYVDLNQIKAGLAGSLETSTCSGIHQRLQAWQQREVEASVEHFRETSPEGYTLERADMARLLADCFLAPIGNEGPSLFETTAIRRSDSGRLEIAYQPQPPVADRSSDSVSSSGPEEGGVVNSPPQTTLVQETTAPGPESASPPEPRERSADERAAGHSDREEAASDPRPQPARRIHGRLQPRRRRRASEHAFLGIPRDQYLQIVQWTAQQLAGEDAQPPPDDVAAVLRQWGLEPTQWCTVIERFGEWFHRAVGHADHVLQVAQHTGHRWLQGIRACRSAFT